MLFAFQKEQEYKDRPYIEVVLLGSRSIEDVKVTHARYFGEIPDDGGLEQIRSMGQSLQFANPPFPNAIVNTAS